MKPHEPIGLRGLITLLAAEAVIFGFLRSVTTNPSTFSDPFWLSAYLKTALLSVITVAIHDIYNANKHKRKG